LKVESVGKLPVTDAASCDDLMEWSTHLPECGAMPSEGIQGNEWGTYITLERTTRTNMGSPTGRDFPMATEAP